MTSITMKHPEMYLRLVTDESGAVRKQEIRKFADLNNLLDLRTFCKWGTLWVCDLRTRAFIADWKL